MRHLISWIRGLFLRDGVHGEEQRRLRVAISKADRLHLEALVRATDTPKSFADRARVLLLLAEGKSATQTSAETGVSLPVIYRWSRRYRQSGLAGLQDWPSSMRPQDLTAKFRQMIHHESAKVDRANRQGLSSDSSMRHWIDRAHKERCYSGTRLLEFVVTYLEEDPWYQWSGFTKEAMLTRLKRSPLAAKFQGRMRRVLVDAVKRRGSREFKRYCRLAIVIADEALVEELETVASAPDKARSGRAKMMLRWVAHHRQS